MAKRKKLSVKTDNIFPGWVVIKDQLYEPIEYVITQPEWFDSKKHSVVGYNND